MICYKNDNYLCVNHFSILDTSVQGNPEYVQNSTYEITSDDSIHTRWFHFFSLN